MFLDHLAGRLALASSGGLLTSGSGGLDDHTMWNFPGSAVPCLYGMVWYGICKFVPQMTTLKMLYMFLDVQVTSSWIVNIGSWRALVGSMTYGIWRSPLSVESFYI